MFVTLDNHPIFERDSTEIFCNVPISIVDAALGGSVEVPTVSGGRVKVKIPPGSQNGDQFRLNGKGMPALRSISFGDMIITLIVEIPKNQTLYKHFCDGPTIMKYVNPTIPRPHPNYL